MLHRGQATQDLKVGVYRAGSKVICDLGKGRLHFFCSAEPDSMLKLRDDNCTVLASHCRVDERPVLVPAVAGTYHFP